MDSATAARAADRDAAASRWPFVAGPNLGIFPIKIPAGPAYVGAWLYGPTGFTRQDTCATPNKYLAVPEFWLEGAPVRTADYADCVTDGACSPPAGDPLDPDTRPWNDPGRKELPASVNYEQAASFCAWRLGRLPTWAEIVRAAQGDAAVVGVQALTQAAVDCYASPGLGPDASPICNQLLLMQFPVAPSSPIPPNPVYRVAAVLQDVGPFNNGSALVWDLFGSVYEWTRTQVDPLGASFCGLSDGTTDFRDHLPGDLADGHILVQFATSVVDAVRSGPSDRPVTPWAIAASSTTRYSFGFRCAYETR